MKHHPCPLVFGSPECGYVGEANICDKTFDCCRKLGNEANFRGWPGYDVPMKSSRPVPRYSGHSTPTRGELLMPEKYLMVGLTPDGREICMNIPMPIADLEASLARGGHHIIFSADQARGLARLLLRKADECK